LSELGLSEVATDAPQALNPPANLMLEGEEDGDAADLNDLTEADSNPHIAEAQLLLTDVAPTMTGSPTGAIVIERAQAKIRRGYTLAQRGASFAARSEFVEALRMIAEAKDQKHGAPRRSLALANGLRALEEAADFAPHGADLDADLDLAVIVSSHRTAVAKVPEAAQLMPQQLADLYFRYAQLQLGGAVAGEPAGSMALHALGKIHSQLGRTEPELNPQADRRAFALQQAALLARDDNHLAAHELGVLLAESGHYIESDHLLSQVASLQPHPVVFRNWARVQRKLGRDHMALASEQHAQALVARGASGGPVTWVPPAKLAQTGDPSGSPTPTAQVANAPAAPRPRPSSKPVAPQSVHNVSRLPGGYMR
jgi:tetratricopeptide (TPR) repeat protein